MRLALPGVDPSQVQITLHGNNGTLAYGDATDDLRLTKWTYRPR